jgi:hypothetical protein
VRSEASIRSRWVGVVAVGLCGWLVSQLVNRVEAFPPAPFSTIYGDIRDEYGYLIPAAGAKVVFYYQQLELFRYPLSGGGE